MDVHGPDDMIAALALARRAKGRALTPQEALVVVRQASRSGDEQQILDIVQRSKGRALTPQEEHFALEQARAFGDLD